MTEQKTSFACKECGLEFAVLYDLRVHADTHSSSEKPPITKPDSMQSQTPRTVSPLKQWFPTAALGILFALAVAQTIEIYRLRGVVFAQGQETQNTESQGSNLPPSLQNLPNMVGGC
ncbi:MAG: C2H2-type zinc finger protein [Candidatus Jacksonbacteria bacterium]|nr:C2H2-type zinc finger protein [Candidatus Jacksonbacteria bacterium]